jgi:Mor family transcriptional regulator
MTLMSRQQQIRESREKPGAQGTVDHDRLRKAISRYAPTVKLDGKDKASLARMGRALDAAIIEAQNQVKANGGKPLTDTQVDGIARQIMMPVNISVNWGRDLVVPRFEGRERIRELGKRYSGDKSSLYDVIRADIQRKENRVPSDEEVIQKARMYQQATMGGGS